MTSKQRAYLKGLAMNIDPVFQIGKASVTPENIEAIAEVFNTRELVKIAVLKNCIDDPKEIANVVAERTRSQVVQVIGKKFVLYKPFKENPNSIKWLNNSIIWWWKIAKLNTKNPSNDKADIRIVFLFIFLILIYAINPTIISIAKTNNPFLDIVKTVASPAKIINRK